MKDQQRIQVGETRKLRTSCGLVDVEILEVIPKKNGSLVRWSSRGSTGISLLSSFFEEVKSNSISYKYKSLTL